MNTATTQRCLVVGLGLSGASSLRHLARLGAELVVTDSRPEPAGVEDLRRAYPQVEFRLGGFDAPRPLRQFDMAVISPGLSLQEPFIQELRAAGVELVGDIELFARAVRAPVIGITGSNGKSTVTTLVAAMAQAAGLKVAVGGNLAPPALDLLADGVELYVLELSSFQLETTHSLACRAATILNLSEDHLDRHGSMAAYAAAKARVWERCGLRVANRDDAAVMALLGHADATAQTFGLDAPGANGRYGLVEHRSQLWLAAPEPLLPVSELRIAGLHNAANALAALALADAAGIPRTASLAALREYAGLPHRCALVAEIAGARYYNDSKGTNVGSTLAAIKGLPAPVIWLGGGQGKGQDFRPLAGALADKASAAILFGEDAPQIAEAIGGSVPVYREPDLHAALRRAHTLARPGASVLLSPACASFDQFKNYMDRGAQFEAAVRALA